MVDKKLSTYFGIVSVSYKPVGIRVDATTEGIIVTDGKGTHNLSWAVSAEATLNRYLCVQVPGVAALLVSQKWLLFLGGVVPQSSGDQRI